jgi:4,5-DOPA dioxygenase extradiol
MPNERMPAAFINHGPARMTIEKNDRTRQWAELQHRMPAPRAIVVVSAHWFIHASAVTAMAEPRTIHDFFYQSPELYAFEYPAKGDPQLAERLVELVKPTWLGLDYDSWGLDHGAYSILAHAFPEADVPVVQLSVHASMPFRYHLELGALLDPLRDEQVLVLTSGTLVHSARATDEAAKSSGDFARAVAFVDAVREVMTTDPARADELEHHPGYPICSPTPDHFLPILYLAGLARASGEKASVLIDDSGRGFGPGSFGIGMAEATAA